MGDQKTNKFAAQGNPLYLNFYSCENNTLHIVYRNDNSIEIGLNSVCLGRFYEFLPPGAEREIVFGFGNHYPQKTCFNFSCYSFAKTLYEISLTNLYRALNKHPLAFLPNLPWDLHYSALHDTSLWVFD